MENSKEILPEISRLSNGDIHDLRYALDTNPLNKAIKKLLDFRGQEHRVATLYHKALLASENEVAYLKERLAIVEPAMECLAKESLEIYDKELNLLDKKYKI